MHQDYINLVQRFKNGVPKEQDDLIRLVGAVSSRVYWRYVGAKEKLVVCHYTEKNQKEAIERYAYWQKKYTEMGLNVPVTYHIDLEQQLVIQQDVGDLSLQKHLAFPQNGTEEKTLTQAVDALDKIRKINSADYTKPLPRFNLDKLQFENNFTMQYLVQDYLGVKSEKNKEQLNAAWLPILKYIASLPEVLCHRDYHGGNMMVHKDQLYVIDFQDTMLGSVYYDLCSLLDDCYIKYHAGTYQKMMRHFYEHMISATKIQQSYDEFFLNYHRVKLQRQYKALGSFASVWKLKNNPRYLKYIGYVVESMKNSFEILDDIAVQEVRKIFLGLYYEN